MSSFTREYLAEAAAVLAKLDGNAVDAIIEIIAGAATRGGRIFFLGVGGSAANASHAVNDFRKILKIEAYAPSDNIAELTARANDDGWETIFVEWLRVSRLNSTDVVFVLSVSGGDTQKNISANIVAALRFAREVGSRIVGIVGRDNGYTAEVADACVVIPAVNPEHVTQHSEAFQPLVWHLMVSHPALRSARTSAKPAS